MAVLTMGTWTALSEKELTCAYVKLAHDFLFSSILTCWPRGPFSATRHTLSYMNTPQAEIKRRVTELLDLVGLGDKHDSYPANLQAAGGGVCRNSACGDCLRWPAILGHTVMKLPAPDPATLPVPFSNC